jgi:hypothetical protein
MSYLEIVSLLNISRVFGYGLLGLYGLPEQTLLY